jgi:hypothetical protein
VAQTTTRALINPDPRVLRKRTPALAAQLVRGAVVEAARARPVAGALDLVTSPTASAGH